MTDEWDNEKIKRVIEAALFMTPTTLTVESLAKIANTNVAVARVTINELRHEYESKGSALEISEDSNGFKMYVTEEYEDYVAHLASSPEFHKGIMKTLAYIAYKQPIKQSDVIKYRNVKAYDHIKMLEEKGFILREKRPPTYILRTTKKFFEYFGEDVIKQQKLTVDAKKMERLRAIKTEKQNEKETATSTS